MSFQQNVFWGVAVVTLALNTQPSAYPQSTAGPILTNAATLATELAENIPLTCDNQAPVLPLCGVVIPDTGIYDGRCGTCGSATTNGLYPRKTSPEITGDSMISISGSYVNNRSFAYSHWAQDYVDPTGERVLQVRREFRTRPVYGTLVGSFGPDQWLGYDISLQFSMFRPDYIEALAVGPIDTDTNATGLYEAIAMDYVGTGYLSEYARSNPAVAGILDPPHRTLRINVLDSSMQVLTPTSSGYASPKYIAMYLVDGRVLVFECINCDTYPAPTTGDHQFTNGRLVSYQYPSGKKLVFAYKSFTGTQLTADPTLQWQIDTIADGARTIEVDYATTQVGGRWVISQLTYPGGRTTDYQYNSTNLTTVTHEDGSESTFTYGTGPNGLLTVEISDPLAEPGHRKKKVWFSGFTSTYGGNVVSTTKGLTRLVESGEGEIAYANYTTNDSNAPTVIYEGGGTLQTPDMYNYRRHFTDWAYTTVGGEASISGSLESSYEELWATYTVDASGHRIDYAYDSNDAKPVIRKTYEDGTLEAFCYVTNTGLVTRYRDRRGKVTRYTYDSEFRLTRIEYGLEDDPNAAPYYDPYAGGWVYNSCPTSDVQTAEYAYKDFEYYASGVDGAGQLKAVIDELGNRTDYEYNSAGQLISITEPSDTVSGQRAETQFAYDTRGRVDYTTNPDGEIVTNTYDSMDRIIKKTYADGTSEEKVYGTSGTTTGLLVRTIDRGGVVTTLSYDEADRLVSKTSAYSQMDGTTETLTPEIAVTETYAYLDGTSRPVERTSAGSASQFEYDYRGRLSESTVNPSSGVALASTRVYLDNQLFSSEDPYGRKTYYAYDASDGRLIRTVVGTVPGWAPTTLTNAGIFALTRDTAANAQYVIQDLVFDASGNVVDQYDGREVRTHNEYDSRNRRTNQYAAYGTSLEARTETLYDDASNVIEIRSPRYFDSSDTNGYLKAHETWAYNGRNRKASHTEAGGATEEATESFTYDLKGRLSTHTDFRGNVWTTIYDSCCDHAIASKNPLGHGSIRNSNSRGLVVHTATVSDVDDHVADMASPVDAKTLGEVTTRYDGRGRPVASTTWLVALGAVDREDPPIAGLDSVSAANGLTTQYLYDDNLTDGVGLDSSGGVSYTKMSASGTSSVSLTSAMTQLAASQTGGGAGISFDTDAPGRAAVVINGQDEISFTIQDATGRAVMSGKLDNYSGTANALLTWSTQLHDTVTTVSGYGDCLETRSIDALGKATKALVDGAGRTIRSIDQLGNATAYTYDASGNQLSVRDPNSVGRDIVYDALGRAGLTTDTASDTTDSSYDMAGNRIAAFDGKSNSTTYAFDARGRQKSQTDRLSGVTSFTYLATGQLASLTDAESQATSYTYDDAGRKLTETYPDHTGGTPGQATYGIVTFTNDAAGRLLRKQDQKGDTCTYLYDLAGRLTERDYRTLANSPSGTIADSDTFTYDKASRMLTAVSGRYSNTVEYTYDTAGRKATEGLTIAGQTYTTTTGYNTRGELTSTTYPDGTAVGRSYTDRGELYQLTHASTTIDTRTYDNGGRITGSSYNNGVSESRSYNADNTLSGISFTGASIGNLYYGWDDNKNKTGETIGGTMSGYGFSIPTNGYDDEDRLVDYNRTDGNLDQSWSLSEVGDWDNVTTEGTAQSRTHGPTHELLTAGGSSVSTDVKGNITLIPSALRPNSSSLLLNWDFDNRLNTADVGNNSSIDVTYKFDALGRRVFRDDGTNAVVYVQSGQQTIADYPSGTAASSPTYRYIYASYIDEPVLRYKPSATESLYYHRNQQYSIVALTDGSGAIVERYAYSAYGAPTIADGSGSALSASAYSNRYTYTGREWDSGLMMYHYRARMCDSSLGRFCSRDPIGFRGSKWDLYEFLRSRPLEGFDPMGLEYLDLPATPDKCWWAVFYMKYYALVRGAGTWDNILLAHYMDSSGTPLELSMGAFDDGGWKRRSMAKSIATIAEAAARAATPCNDYAFGSGVLVEAGKSYTVMVLNYTMTAYYGWGAVKTCCNGKCKRFAGSYHIDFVATDRTDFNANDGVYVFGLGFSDRLINACGIGKSFDITGKASTSGSFSGCN